MVTCLSSENMCCVKKYDKSAYNTSINRPSFHTFPLIFAFWTIGVIVTSDIDVILVSLAQLVGILHILYKGWDSNHRHPTFPQLNCENSDH